MKGLSKIGEVVVKEDLEMSEDQCSDSTESQPQVSQGRRQ